MDIHLTGLDKFGPKKLAEQIAQHELVSVYIPMPSIGYAGEHLSIAEDYGDALYVGEKLADFDPGVSLRMEYDAPVHRTFTIFTLRATNPIQLAEFIFELQPWFDSQNYEEDAYEEQRNLLRDRILEVTDEVPFRKLRFPELADSFLLNKVNWMSYDLIGEGDASDWEQHLPGQPECRFGFVRSSVSETLNGTCFCSPEAWILHHSVDVARFLQEYGNPTIQARKILPAAAFHDAKGLLVSNGRVTVRPSTRIVHASHTMLKETGRIEAVEQLTYMLSADGSALFIRISTWIIVDFDASTRLLDQEQLEETLRNSERETELLRACLGRPTDLKCEWFSITDEAFESLCWDVLYDCGQFDKTSMKKFGLSRSRDGGRDIQADRLIPGRDPQRFIFQCKRITTGRSLSGSKLAVSDVVDQYGARGFGVMTCTTVDATLHDKLDAISANRGIGTDVWDSLRIERFLGDHLYIRDRYFAGQ